MATLIQTLKQLKTQRSRLEGELKRLRQAIAALEKLVRTGGARGGRTRDRRVGRELSAAVRNTIVKVQQARRAKARRQTGFARDRARLLRQRKGAKAS